MTHPTSRRGTRRRQAFARALMLLLLVPTLGAAAQSATLTAPAPVLVEIAAGPWTMSVVEVVTGDAATTLVTAADPTNLPPAAGFTYVAVRVKVVNASSTQFTIDDGDFAIVSASGRLSRSLGVIPPGPVLRGTVAPGESLEGWLVGGASVDEASLLLTYDSATIAGTWSDAAFALTSGATLPPVDNRAQELNQLGRVPSDPAGIGTLVATDEWTVELLEVVRGEAVVNLFPASDYRTTALLGGGADETPPWVDWVALNVRMTNNRTGTEVAYLPLTAFLLADGDGNPVPDILLLSAPAPEAAGGYLPGVARTGWVVFDAVGYGGSLVRFLPYRTDLDARYLSWDPAIASTGDSTGISFAVDARVVTTEDLVRLRATPSTDGEIVDELPRGTGLRVTGPPQEGSGFTWYPVSNDATGDTGFVALPFIRAAD